MIFYDEDDALLDLCYAIFIFILREDHKTTRSPKTKFSWIQ